MAANNYYSQNGVVVEASLDPDDIEKRGQLNMQVGNPCPNHPSDHYSLVYKV